MEVRLAGSGWPHSQKATSSRGRQRGHRADASLAAAEDAGGTPPDARGQPATPAGEGGVEPCRGRKETNLKLDLSLSRIWAPPLCPYTLRTARPTSQGSAHRRGCLWSPHCHTLPSVSKSLPGSTEGLARSQEQSTRAHPSRSQCSGSPPACMLGTSERRGPAQRQHLHADLAQQRWPQGVRMASPPRAREITHFWPSGGAAHRGEGWGMGHPASAGRSAHWPCGHMQPTVVRAAVWLTGSGATNTDVRGPACQGDWYPPPSPRGVAWLPAGMAWVYRQGWWWAGRSSGLVGWAPRQGMSPECWLRVAERTCGAGGGQWQRWPDRILQEGGGPAGGGARPPVQMLTPRCAQTISSVYKTYRHLSVAPLFAITILILFAPAYRTSLNH